MQTLTIAQALTMSPKIAYSIEESAVVSGLSRATLYRELMSGRLSSLRDGRRRVIPRAELEAYMQRRLEQ